MEDDDEFGDLYTDVLRPFAASSASAPQDHHQSSSTPQSLLPLIDLNLQTGDDEILYRPNSDQSIHQSTVPNSVNPVQEPTPPAAADSGRNLICSDQKDDGRVEREGNSADMARDVGAGDLKLPHRALEDVKSDKESAIDPNGSDVNVKDACLVDKDVKFDIEEDNIAAEMGSEPIIPGLSSGTGSGNRKGALHGSVMNLEAPRMDEESGGRGGGDDWDSDSEDDLQIVLNDNNIGHMGMERGGMMGDDDGEVEDVGDTNQATAEQEWGEDLAQAPDSERKEMVEAGKPSGGLAGAPKVGYSNHGYHPFHSQFKYVRPGAATMPGATAPPTGGPPGQVRPHVNLAPMVGRGRGDWRPPGMKNAPPLQKGFHVWGNSGSGRGFGSGLEFTLPSHKTIFDVDIDNFEEKPWKYPGIDTSDFFNFGLNEETWKEYCKQLGQLRLESTMQSKIRVYESGRTEQEYDPDLPPELAAATGMHNLPVENANPGKSDVGQSDSTKALSRIRPPLPTGRAIQVEGGYGERLPSIDTRPPRMRDSDAIIEIVLQDADDDPSPPIGVQDQPDNEPHRSDSTEAHAVEEDLKQVDSEYFDGCRQASDDQTRESVGRLPFTNSVACIIHEGDGTSPSHKEEPVDYPGSRGQTPVSSGGNVGSPYEGRQSQGRTHDQSPHLSSSQDIKLADNEKEESAGSMEGKHSAPLSLPLTVKDERESSMKHKDANIDVTVMVDGSSKSGKDEIYMHAANRRDSLNDRDLKRQKLMSRTEPHMLQETDDGEDSIAARSSDNSKARSGSSKEYPKWREGFEEEVIQDAVHVGGSRRHHNDNEQSFRQRDHDGRQEIERKRGLAKSREQPYTYRDWDPSLAHQLHMKADVFDWQKDRDNHDGIWLRRDDDPYARRSRTHESRKRERGEEMGSLHRSKLRDSDRNDKDDNFHSGKQLDNGSHRVHYDKDVGARHRERDDALKGRYETVEDYHVKRRKDEEYLRRDHADKEVLHGYRENTGRHRREKDEVLDQRKRDDQQRQRDNLDDHHSSRHKDESWLQRDRGDRRKDREEWHQLKHAHEEIPTRHERDEGRRGAVKSGRGLEEKVWIGHHRAKEENRASEKDYHRDTAKRSEQSKKKDRVEDESTHNRGTEDASARGIHVGGHDRRSRQDKLTARNDNAASASDNARAHDKKYKENSRKSKDSDTSDHQSMGLYKKSQDDQSGLGLKGSSEPGHGEHETSDHRLSKRNRENISSDDEQKDSRRGRSKLERWTSHQERDYGMNSKSLSSLKFKEKEINKDNNGGSSEVGKPLDESCKSREAVDSHQLLVESKDHVESKDADTKPLGDRHLDTVEKLKKRSERFKLPMPSEKEALAIKKMETEALPSSQSENPVDSVVKQERPARKRRWVSG